MNLGQKIQALRKQAGLSQENLAEALKVSRQAVSKWETGQSYPDTENLLALADLFHISADELAGLRKQSVAQEPQRRSHRPKLLWLLPAALAAAALLYFLLRPATPLPPSRPDVTETGEFCMLWQKEKDWEWLSVGNQNTPFPFGTTLTPSALEQVTATDFSSVTLHSVACGTLSLQYLHVDDGTIPESVCSMETVSEGYETPRGIRVGADESDVLNAYGDALVYCVKEHGEDLLCQHDYLYAYAPSDAFGNAVLFYIRNGHVAGLAVQLGDDAGSDAWAVDNVFRFPVQNGAADFSRRRDPEQEAADATRTVFIALYALENDKNLSAEETYRYRQDIYDNLYALDWQSYGAFGEAEQETQTTEALLRWLTSQKTLSEEELRGLLLGACRSNIDGWATDGYCVTLAKAFIAYPEAYLRVLSGDGFTDAERQKLISMTGFGCDVPEDLHRDALDEAERLVYHMGLSGETLRWATALLERIQSPL